MCVLHSILNLIWCLSVYFYWKHRIKVYCFLNLHSILFCLDSRMDVTLICLNSSSISLVQSIFFKLSRALTLNVVEYKVSQHIRFWSQLLRWLVISWFHSFILPSWKPFTNLFMWFYKCSDWERGQPWHCQFFLKWIS